MSEDLPRPLSEVERAILAKLLDIDHPDAPALRVQVEHAVVTGYCGCGCPSAVIEVPTALARAEHLPNRMWASEGWAGWPPQEPQASDPVGVNIVLFIDDGFLSYLELVSFDDPVTAWPDPADVSLDRPGYIWTGNT